MLPHHLDGFEQRCSPLTSSDMAASALSPSQDPIFKLGGTAIGYELRHATASECNATG